MPKMRQNDAQKLPFMAKAEEKSHSLNICDLTV